MVVVDDDASPQLSAASESFRAPSKASASYKADLRRRTPGSVPEPVDIPAARGLSASNGPDTPVRGKSGHDDASLELSAAS